MTDLTPNDLSHLSDAEFHALCPQGEHAPGAEPLSPAALSPAALADPVAEPTAPPAEGEIDQLVSQLYDYAQGEADNGWHDDAARFRRAAELLERHTAPVPVPVSERLPGDALCWWYEPDEDDDGSGYGGKWTLLRFRGGVSCCTHWLPAHALRGGGAVTDPIPVSQRHPRADECDRYGNCWWFDPHNLGGWFYDTFQATYSHWRPAGALPRPGAQQDP